MKRLKYENGSLDAVDIEILRMLAANARVSLIELARAVAMSSPSVSERLKRLEEVGVIKGYEVALDAEVVGLPIGAWLRIQPLPGRLTRVAEVLNELDAIVECDRITGDDCFLAKAYVPSMGDLEQLLDAIIPYATTSTSIIQSSTVKRRIPKIPGATGTRDGSLSTFRSASSSRR